MTEELMRHLAERQHGVVATWQLPGRARGDVRVGTGHWERATPRVLRRRGSPPTALQAVMVGVLEGGGSAVASHRTAAALWELPGFGFEPVEITCPGRRSSRVPPVAVRHRPVRLLPHHSVVARGVPVTSLPRTVFDLAGLGLREERLVRLVNLVANRSPGAIVALHATLDELAGRGRAGIALMRSVLLQFPVGAPLAGSGLELRFERLLEQAGQRPLRRQVDLGGHDWLGRVDFYDDEAGLVVEVDSRIHHSSPVDVARDSLRDSALLAAGIRSIVRVAEEDIWYRPDRAVEAVRQARHRLASSELGAGRPSGEDVLHRVR